MDLSPAGLALLKRDEGCSLTPYPDAAGHSIGYGHYIQPFEAYLLDGIDQAGADRLLVQDTTWAQTAINRLVKPSLNQNQFDALVDFVYNVGETAFKQSHLLVLLNDGDWPDAADELRKWTHSNGSVNQDLVARREAERDLFLATV